MSSKSIYYGLKNGHIIHVSEVSRGLACNCVCAECGDKLEAHKGEKTTHHFKHYGNTERDSCFETALHLAAKRLFLKYKSVLLPPVYDHENLDEKLSNQKKYKIEDIESECWHETFRPDLLATLKVKKKKVFFIPLIIEIRVTHQVDEEKIVKIRHSQISAIEINLSKVERIVNDEILWKELQNPENLKWLFNRQYNHLKTKAEYKKKLQDEKRVLKEKQRQKEREEEEKANREELKGLWKQGLSLLKTYDIYKRYLGETVDNYDYTEGNVFCPKDVGGGKIGLKKCKQCIFYHDEIFDRENWCTRIICGFKNDIPRKRVFEDIED